MQNDINAVTDRGPLGKGVFKPSRAPIAREMKARLELGGSKAKLRPTQATGSERRRNAFRPPLLQRQST